MVTTGIEVLQRRLPRLQDVADAAGVHVSTVSRALNHETSTLLNPETVERVRHVADALGYQANGMARALRTRRSLAIGVLVPDITNPFFPPIVRGAGDALAVAGYSLVLINTDNRCKVRRQLTTMLETQVDGLLLVTALREDELVDELRCSGAPVALVNRAADRGDASSPAVISDDLQGITLAVTHLVGLGHQRIAYVGSRLDVSATARRNATFHQVTRRLGLPNAVTVDSEAFDEAAGCRAAAELFDSAAPPTGIVAGNDLMALGVLDAAAARGLRCPQDVSVVGFNDMPCMDRFEPTLTTVRVAKYDLGQRAAELLLALIHDPAHQPETVVIAPDLVVRNSTGPPGCALSIPADSGHAQLPAAR